MMREKPELENVVAIVTGGSCGIRKAITEIFADGAVVVVADLVSPLGKSSGVPKDIGRGLTLGRAISIPSN